MVMSRDICGESLAEFVRHGRQTEGDEKEVEGVQQPCGKARDHRGRVTGFDPGFGG